MPAVHGAPTPTVLIALGGPVPAYLLAGTVPHAYAMMVLLGVIGFFASMWNVATVSLRQTVVPAALLGRGNAVYRMLSLGLAPVGALAGGFVAHDVGVRAAYPIAGLVRGGALLVALPALLRVTRSARSTGRDGTRHAGPSGS